MQVAVNAILFFLGFAAAIIISSRPRQSRSDIVKFLNKLRFVTNGIKSASPPAAQEKKQLLPDENEKDIRGKETDPEPAQLLTKGDVERIYDENDWQRLAYEDFKTTILAKGSGLKTFPCVYATMGYRSDDHRYVFLESDNAAEPRNIRLLAPALLKYLRMSKTLGDNTSLVIMAAPSEGDRTVQEYNDMFWDMLRGLRIWDPKPWPTDIPEDVQDKNWMFCFDGAPIFPVSLSPAHSRRWSRHQSVPLIALQPKWVLDKLLATPEKRQAATGKVRKLLEPYDQITISPDLTNYGEEGTSEVRQLCLMDENETAQCPYGNFSTAFGHPKVKHNGPRIESIS